MKFYELAIGARFFVRGRRFQKLGMGLAKDAERIGHAFMGDVEVMADGEPLLLPPEEAARWNPSDRRWTESLRPAPGQRTEGCGGGGASFRQTGDSGSDRS